jgi:type I restriction enzyme S subunit
VSDLPKGWVKVSLGKILELKYGKSLPAKVRTGQGVPVYGSNGVVGFHSDALIFQSGLIVGRKGSFGVVHRCDEPFFPIDTTYFIDEFYDQPISYWYHFLRYLPLTAMNRSTAIPGLNREDAYGLEFGLPPLNEQFRIADKLDSMLAKVDAAQARLDKIPNILKRFRQSVLAAATSGELTKEWRDKNQAKYSFKEYVFDDLLVELRNGLSPKPNQEGKGTAILRISSVRSGFVEQSDIRHLECDKKTVDKYKLQIGDLLFTRYNGSIDFVGVCGLIRQLKHNELVYPDKLIRARLNTIAIPEYIEIYFSSDQARRNMTDCIKSTSGQKGISGKDIKAQKVIVPSTLEQKEIVSRVENLFAIVEKIEKQYLDAKAKTNRLTQSILAKAFRGELVLQNESDEPANELLVRIKEQIELLKPRMKGTK